MKEKSKYVKVRKRLGRKKKGRGNSEERKDIKIKRKEKTNVKCQYRKDIIFSTER